jgi:proline iminopeptidase
LLRAQRFITHSARIRPSLISGVLLAVCTILQCATAAAVSIKRSEYFPFDGAKLYLLVRSADNTAPVLLWLHGGPGGAERPLFRYFNSDLEKHFVVVYWDQRGAGRSFDPKADRRRLTIAQHLADLDAVVNHLRESLGRDKVILVGHSWGAALGLLYGQAHSEKVSAFIGVNPLISVLAAQEAEYDFVLKEASQRNHTEVVARAQKIGRPPFKSAREKLAVEKLVQRYGGIFHTAPNRLWVMLRAIFTVLVTPWEIRRIIQGNNVSLEAMNQELLSLDLTHSVPSLEVPIVFFLGRYDRHVDARIAHAYLKGLRAPIKRVVWFENSAHNVPFEEPRLFNASVVRELQSLGIGNE